MFYADVLRHLTTGEPAPREEMRRWIESGDLLTWSALFALFTETRATQLPTDEAADFMRRYLLRCIEENPTPGDYLHGGYEAAWELAALLKLWRKRGGSLAASIRGIAIELEKLYRRGDAATKNRVLCGVLEHALEDKSLRRYFKSWDRDPELKEAYTLALDWGASHEE
jgi:hypothetical protein